MHIELQNCVEISSHTSEPGTILGFIYYQGVLETPCQKAHESASFRLLIFGKPKSRFVLSSRY